MIAQIFALVVSLVIVIISLVCGCVAGLGREVTGGSSRPPMTELQRGVASEYANLRLPAHKIPFEEFCYPKRFRLQNPQRFIAEYMSPGTRNMNLLGFHRIGAGKTCAAITAAELWVSRGRPLVVMPAGLIPGFRNELRGPCPRFEYVTVAEREELGSLAPGSDRYKDIVRRADALIDGRYDIMSYNKFAQLTAPERARLDPPVMVVDEVHNINNPSGTYYGVVRKFVRDRPDMRLIVLSATPIFDHASELVSLLRLMRQDVDDRVLDDPGALRGGLDGIVSYYEGAPEHTFPRTTLHYEVCKMSRFQSKWFRAEVEAELKRSGNIDLKTIANNFYAKSRAKSNMVFPHGLSGSDGLPKLTKKGIVDGLETYSCKFARLVKKLRKGQLSFVYTNFTSFGGIKSMTKCLEAFGFVSYNKHGPGPRRYAVWTGEQTPREKDAIRSVFNAAANDGAGQLQIILGSPAMKEGVSLLRVRQVHVMEPYWNHSRLEQIYGRAVRFCSHKSLPRSDRVVDIYLYIAVTADSSLTKGNFDRKGPVKPTESVDKYILDIADHKREQTSDLIRVLQDMAVDRGLNQAKK